MRVRPRVAALASLLFSMYVSFAMGQTPAIKELFGFSCNASTGLCPDASAPSGALMQASDGNFYGTTLFGTHNTNTGGGVFRISPTGQVALLHEFVPDVNGTFSNGNGTVGGLVE